MVVTWSDNIMSMMSCLSRDFQGGKYFIL
jgi:hypothetical protein